MLWEHRWFEKTSKKTQQFKELTTGPSSCSDPNLFEAVTITVLRFQGTILMYSSNEIILDINSSSWRDSQIEGETGPEFTCPGKPCWGRRSVCLHSTTWCRVNKLHMTSNKIYLFAEHQSQVEAVGWIAPSPLIEMLIKARDKMASPTPPRVTTRLLKSTLSNTLLRSHYRHLSSKISLLKSPSPLSSE